MAVTGLILSGFVVAHMLGNLQIFLGPAALNGYAEHLQEMPYLLWPARVILLATLILHMALAAQLTLENRKARPVAYAFKDTVQASYASRTMMMSGIIIFLFIVYHLLHFTFGLTNPEYYGVADDQGRHDVYAMVVMSFRDAPIAFTYILAMAVLCLHLSHGLRSFPQSLGFDTQKHAHAVDFFAWAFTVAIFLGNCSIPAAVFLNLIALPGRAG